MADGTHQGWPKAEQNVGYALFYPQGVLITLQGMGSCSAFGGYHNNGSLADSTLFGYMVMPRCSSNINSLTSTTSHELVEWATDPFPSSKPAYQFVDFDHVIWALGIGGEVADLCNGFNDSWPIDNYIAQRSWSNLSAKESHDPCVPAPMEPYFNSAPELKDSVTFTYQGQPLKTKGVKVPVGQSKTIPVFLYSDMATPDGPWTVTARDRFGGQYLKFSFDRNTGQNGDVLQMTITSLKAATSGASSFVVTSTDKKNRRHSWIGLVGFN